MVLLPLPLLAALHLAAPQPELRRVPTQAQQVALTVNVVWGTEYVPKMVQVLKEHHAKATFFLGGRWAQAHPQEAKAIAAAGMEIGNHGDAHRHVAQLGVPANEREISEAAAKIEAATGVRPKLYAPAYGELSPAVREAASRQGVRIVMWSADTIDWRKSHTPAIIVQRVVSRLQPGTIVLMHPTDRTLQALPTLLRALQSRGYAATSVGDLMRAARAAG